MEIVTPGDEDLEGDVMRKTLILCGALIAPLLLAWSVTGQDVADAPGDGASPYDAVALQIAETTLTPEERAGAEIWYKGTFGNGRFHTYVYQQRLGVLIDWYRVLNSNGRDERFKIWGLINDPNCCTPGSEGCPAKSLEETYGFDWCPGDEELLAHVGRHGYRDPACDFVDPDGLGNKQTPCDVAFGTSTGALGLRKFPNPRFDAERWAEINDGDPGTWEGYTRPMDGPRDNPRLAVSHLADPSVEPPFLVGMACGTCHIAFDPTNPPEDPAHPKWENLMGAIGNQYTRVSEIMASGMSKNSLEFQLFGHARPGTVDTSAVPNDQVNNPGTMNAIINFDRRPAFEQEMVSWMATESCPQDADDDICWCEPGKPGKCWERSRRTGEAHGILKGGEDSVGVLEAIRRVYFNIGACSERCWLNHLTDLRQIDPQQRNYGQTAFDIGQCRRDCPNFRALEDRLHLIGAFLLTRRPTDLWKARGLDDPGDLVEQLEAEHGDGAVERGRVLFARNCARCHSSQPGPDFERYTFAETDAEGVRIDWLGNEEPTPVSEVGTYRCRALHSNHMEGHVWEEFASETYRDRSPDPNIPDESGGGRGYMRNISLLNVWAHAPFMHNNGIGPEICGKPSREDFYTSPYVDDNGERLPPDEAPECWEVDPGVEGRYALYEASMDALLNPDRRVPKITLRNEPIVLELGPRLIERNGDGAELLGVHLELPEGRSTGMLVSLQHKEMARDIVLARTDFESLESRLVEEHGEELGTQYAETLRSLSGKLVRSLRDPYRVLDEEADILFTLYSSCTAEIENAGHRFGEDLSDDDKKALTAFLATL